MQEDIAMENRHTAPPNAAGNTIKDPGDWTTADKPMTCAVDKQSERRSHRRSTLERGVVKQPPYFDLATGEGV
jgi:hypothetical protein